MALVLKILIYRDFKKITLTNFQTELVSKLNSRNSYEYCIFEKCFVEVLDNHAPKKMTILRRNQKPHVNKTLRSAIVKRSQFRNKAIKSKSKNDIIEYKKRPNKVVKLNKRYKK